MSGCEDCNRSASGKACRIWLTCPTLNDIERKRLRLLRKEISIEVAEYYDNYFKINIQSSDIVCNGG